MVVLIFILEVPNEKRFWGHRRNLYLYIEAIWSYVYGFVLVMYNIYYYFIIISWDGDFALTLMDETSSEYDGSPSIA